MAKKIKIEFISSGFREILEGDGVHQLVTDTATRIQQEANAGIDEESEGFSVDVWEGNYGGGRWIGSVTSQDRAAAAAQSEYQVLSKAVHP